MEDYNPLDHARELTTLRAQELDRALQGDGSSYNRKEIYDLYNRYQIAWQRLHGMLSQNNAPELDEIVKTMNYYSQQTKKALEPN